MIAIKSSKADKAEIVFLKEDFAKLQTKVIKGADQVKKNIFGIETRLDEV